MFSWSENSTKRAAGRNHVSPLPLKLARPCVLSWKERSWVYFATEKRSFKSWQWSSLVQSTLLHQLSRKVPYLAFDFDVLIFPNQIKWMGERLFYPLSFPLHRTQKDLPVTQTALHSGSLCLLLGTPVLFTGFFTQKKLLPEKQKFGRWQCWRWARLLKNKSLSSPGWQCYLCTDKQTVPINQRFCLLSSNF